MKEKAKDSRRQQLLVLLVAVAIVMLSAGSTLYFSGVFGGFGRGADAAMPGYRNVTFTDAYLECEAYTRERYSERMQHLTLDNHSSRYDHASNRYKIFLSLQMRKPPREPLPEPYWVNCFVNSESGQIAEYQVGLAKDAPVKPVRKEPSGNFGWP